MPPLRSYIVTFNCGREPLNPSQLGAHLFNALPKPFTPPDIVIFSLQEVAPIAYAFLGGSYLSSYLSPFRHALDIAAAALKDGDNGDAGYVNIITRNVGMTVIMVFVLRSQTTRIQSIEAAGVGVGMHEMGNKGAVAVRLGYSLSASTTPLELTAVAAHLAPMEDGLERRNEDWKNIVRGLVFTPVSSKAINAKTPLRQDSETEPLLSSSSSSFSSSAPTSDAFPPPMKTETGIYTPTTHLLLAGDLNYRTSLTTPLTEEYRSFPQPTSSPSSPSHYSHLFASDQLTTELREGRTCHGLGEAEVAFPPTYKYGERARRDAEGDAVEEMDEEGKQWGWARHRWPSWCDRVLFLQMPSWAAGDEGPGREAVVVHGYTSLPLLPSSDHRPVACCVDIPARAIPPPGAGFNGDATDRREDRVRLDPPFDLDPGWRERRAWARRREVGVGLGAWLALTWEGRGWLLAVVCGAVGGWAVISGLVGSSE